MRILLLPLLCATFLIVETGCGNVPAPAPVHPPSSPSPAVPLQPPDKAQWAGKTLDAALADCLSASSTLASTLKEVVTASNVAPRKSAVTAAAERLRIARFALADLSQGKTLDADMRKKLNDASAAVSQEVARLLEIPEAKKAFHEAFMLVRTAPAP